MDRPSNPDLTTTYEVLGSYFVDIYFNLIFDSSGREAAESVTDAYRKKVDAFIRGMRQEERSYDTIVQRLYDYFRTHLRFTTLSFAEFVDVVVKTVAPPDYFGQLRAKEKDALLQSILVSLIVDLGAHAVSPEMIRRIIDRQDARAQVTVQMLQDKAVEVLLAKRDAIMHAFISSKHRASNAGAPPEVVAQLQDALRRVLKDLKKAKARHAEDGERIEELEGELLGQKRRAAKLEQIVLLLKEERQRGAGAARALAGAVPPDTVGERPRRFDLAGILPAPDTLGERPRRAAASEATGSAGSSSAYGSSEATGSEDPDGGEDPDGSEAATETTEETTEESDGGRRRRGKAKGRPAAPAVVASGFFSDDSDGDAEHPLPPPRAPNPRSGSLGGAISRGTVARTVRGRRMAAPPDE